MKIFDGSSRDEQSRRRNGQLQLMLPVVMCVAVEQYVIVCFVLHDGAEAGKLTPGVSGGALCELHPQL